MPPSHSLTHTHTCQAYFTNHPNDRPNFQTAHISRRWFFIQVTAKDSFSLTCGPSHFPLFSAVFCMHLHCSCQAMTYLLGYLLNSRTDFRIGRISKSWLVPKILQHAISVAKAASPRDGNSSLETRVIVKKTLCIYESSMSMTGTDLSLRPTTQKWIMNLRSLQDFACLLTFSDA